MRRYIVIVGWSSSRRLWCGQVVDTWYHTDNIVNTHFHSLPEIAEELAEAQANKLNTEIPTGIVA